jgi:hypothetical protein
MDYLELNYIEREELCEILTKQYGNQLIFEDNKIDRILVFNSSPESTKKAYEIWLQQYHEYDNPEKIRFFSTKYIFFIDLNGNIINKFPIPKNQEKLLETLDAISPLIFKDIQLFILAIQKKLKLPDLPIVEINHVDFESLSEDKLKSIYTSILLSQEAINDHCKIKSNFEGNLPQRYISISFFVLNLTREEVLKKLYQLKDGDFDGFRL